MSTVVGDVRPSQLLWTFGPGALIDLPNISVLTMGTDKWDPLRCKPLQEARLLAEVQSVLGDQVKRLLKPPVVEDDKVDPFSAEAKIGVPVYPFPRWLRCVRCGLLGSYDSGLFKLKGADNPHRRDQIHFIHENCKHRGNSDAVAARFLVACRNGHLDDFPWHWYVHGGPSTCTGTLRFFERGASLQTENLWVKCEGCGKGRSLVNAFGENAEKYLPRCRGRNPHLDSYEECTENCRTVLLGASNGWFPIQRSVLAIPLQGDTLSQIIDDGWGSLNKITQAEQVELVVDVLKTANVLPGIERFTNDEIWAAIEKKRSGNNRANVHFSDLKSPEWEVLTKPNPPTDLPHFLSEKTDVPQRYSSVVEEVLLLKRLREVNALIGFTRVEAPEETLDPDERAPMAALSNGQPDWVPANEVHGEGIFIKFNESILAQWENLSSVKEREEHLVAGYKGWRDARKLVPEKGFPGVRFAMLHTLSHLLIREMALECGYNAASIRERIYSTNDTLAMAGILLYTAAADSDGTLGGLVELGKKENLENILSKALERATICSSDPLCFEHDPAKDRSLHSAACHACSFVGETSCEIGNRFLDRSLLVKTFDSEDAAFFKNF